MAAMPRPVRIWVGNGIPVVADSLHIYSKHCLDEACMKWVNDKDYQAVLSNIYIFIVKK